MSKEEVESGASVTQTPEVYEPNLCKQPGKNYMKTEAEIVNLEPTLRPYNFRGNYTLPFINIPGKFNEILRKIYKV